MLDTLNNREIATLFWLLVLFVWLIGARNIRVRLIGVIKSLAQPVIVIPTGLMLAHMYVLILLTEKAVGYDKQDIKTFIFWLLIVSIPLLLFGSTNATREDAYFYKIVRRFLRHTLVIEYIVGLYSFSLLVEFISIPIVSLFAMLGVYVEHEEKYASVKKISNGVLSVYAAMLLYLTLSEVWAGYSEMFSIDRLINFLLPIALGLWLIPFLYLFTLYLLYNHIFGVINIFSGDTSITRYAKSKTLISCHLNLKKLRKFSKMLGYFRFNDILDVHRAFDQLKIGFFYKIK